ncbi:MAG TPA: AraC family transcriptional regulator [Candidatus Baltobacteraceae bacterium]|nr:AraC family transcriptional regulator [Candidatus Baltobacteraceae bacterium]
MNHRAIIFAPDCIALAVDYINQNACRGIRPEHVAKEMGYASQRDFCRRYKAATGRTPGKAILQRQLQDARRLLMETEFSIGFIAGNCGFPSHRRFRRAFRAAEGRSPTQFRRKARTSKSPRQILVSQNRGV